MFAQEPRAQQNPVTAIDIALEPDATMIQHAKDANARLLKDFPKGFALDETHHPHVSLLQQFVRTDDLDKVYAAANAVLAKEKPTAWTLKAFKYYYIPSPPVGLAGIVVEPTEDLHRLQDELISAVKPFTVKTGTPAAFFSEEGGRDIQKSLISYVAHFVTDRSRQALQSARDDRCRDGNVFEQDAGGAIPVVHVLGGRRVGLSAGTANSMKPTCCGGIPFEAADSQMRSPLTLSARQVDAMAARKVVELPIGQVGVG